MFARLAQPDVLLAAIVTLQKPFSAVHVKQILLLMKPNTLALQIKRLL